MSRKIKALAFSIPQIVLQLIALAMFYVNGYITWVTQIDASDYAGTQLVRQYGLMNSEKPKTLENVLDTQMGKEGVLYLALILGILCFAYLVVRLIFEMQDKPNVFTGKASKAFAAVPVLMACGVFYASYVATSHRYHFTSEGLPKITFTRAGGLLYIEIALVVLILVFEALKNFIPSND